MQDIIRYSVDTDGIATLTLASPGTLNALSTRLSESLDLYADVLLNPTFPAKELERLRGYLDKQLANLQGVVARLALDLLQQQLLAARIIDH